MCLRLLSCYCLSLLSIHSYERLTELLCIADLCASHNEAVARITWCISERSIGVVTGEVGAGKTVSVRTVLHGFFRHVGLALPNT